MVVSGRHVIDTWSLYHKSRYECPVNSASVGDKGQTVRQEIRSPGSDRGNLFLLNAAFNSTHLHTNADKRRKASKSIAKVRMESEAGGGEDESNITSIKN
jgi:hypothetical protein